MKVFPLISGQYTLASYEIENNHYRASPIPSYSLLQLSAGLAANSSTGWAIRDSFEHDILLTAIRIKKTNYTPLETDIVSLQIVDTPEIQYKADFSMTQFMKFGEAHVLPIEAPLRKIWNLKIHTTFTIEKAYISCTPISLSKIVNSAPT